mgnify:CR=1 FL=1
MPDTHMPTDLIANVRALAPELAARAAEMEEVRRLPADLAAKLAKAGVFRMITPKSFGGLGGWRDEAPTFRRARCAHDGVPGV